jgi:hypothetical protein
MTGWSSDDLARTGTAEELEIASLRRDGTKRKRRTISVVRHGDDHGRASTPASVRAARDSNPKPSDPWSVGGSLLRPSTCDPPSSGQVCRPAAVLLSCSVSRGGMTVRLPTAPCPTSEGGDG